MNFKFLIIPILSFYWFTIKAQSDQFMVDCGKDTIYCYNMHLDTSYHIGSNVNIANGVAPFSYKWTCRNYSISPNLIFTASDFLNDTSKVNPYFIALPLSNNPLFFYLTVTDKNGSTAIDSITVMFSQFEYFSGYIQLNINEGDSIQLGDYIVRGGIPPLNYYWTPIIGLSDSANLNTWCQPKKSIDYYQYIIDAARCKSSPNLAFKIIVKPTLIATEDYINTHQIGSLIAFNNPQKKVAKIKLYSLDGKKIYETETNDSFIEINNSLIQAKIYIYVLTINENYQTGKFINLTKF